MPVCSIWQCWRTPHLAPPIPRPQLQSLISLYPKTTLDMRYWWENCYLYPLSPSWPISATPIPNFPQLNPQLYQTIQAEQAAYPQDPSIFPRSCPTWDDARCKHRHWHRAFLFPRGTHRRAASQSPRFSSLWEWSPCPLSRARRH